jgi:hypothetical protein
MLQLMHLLPKILILYIFSAAQPYENKEYNKGGKGTEEYNHKGSKGWKQEGGYKEKKHEGGYKEKKHEGGWKGKKDEGGWKGKKDEGGWKGKKDEGGWKGKKDEGGWKGKKDEGGWYEDGKKENFKHYSHESYTFQPPGVQMETRPPVVVIETVTITGKPMVTVS